MHFIEGSVFIQIKKAKQKQLIKRSNWDHGIAAGFSPLFKCHGHYLSSQVQDIVTLLFKWQKQILILNQFESSAITLNSKSEKI